MCLKMYQFSCSFYMFLGHLYQFSSSYSFKKIRFDTRYQAFFCTLIWVRVSYVLDVINKYSSNNDVFYNECVLVVVLFAKRFESVVSNYLTITARKFQLLNDYSKMVSK